MTQALVMTTETWAYFKGQLDFSRKIKIHILKADQRTSYCGLKNYDDIGFMGHEELKENGTDVCMKCMKSFERTLHQ